ncbi:MAG: flagellar biosynthesis protein FlhB [Rhodanobacter sp.]
MAEQENEDRTEKASEKRLQDAREKGEVPRSRDLSGAMVVLAGVTALLTNSNEIYAHARQVYALGLGYSRDALFSDTLPFRALSGALHEGLAIVMPVLIATSLATLASPILLGGLNISAQALQPNFSRLDPISGIGRLFSMNGLVELAKSLLKLTFIGGLLVLLLLQSERAILATGNGPVASGIAQMLTLLGHSGLLFGAVLGLIGGIDAVWQRFDYNRRHRMTKQELRDEHKDSDGSPELKSRIRQVQQQISRKRMMQELPTANVVVVNPSHFAVALKYDDSRMRAPRVIAKGVDVLAQQIRLVASAHRIPLIEAPPLARALYATTQLGHEIPAALYVAVAQILAYVYQLKQATEQGISMPPPPQPEIDPELQGRYREPQP